MGQKRNQKRNQKNTWDKWNWKYSIPKLTGCRKSTSKREVHNGKCLHIKKQGRSQIKNLTLGTSLVAQWLRICLPMQGIWVRSLVQEDPTCRGATKPMCHNYWACALEPSSHNYWAHAPQLLKPLHLEPVLCNEKPPQWEAHTPQPPLTATRESLHTAMKTQHSQK